MRPFVCYTICLLNQLTFRPKVTGANSVSPSFKSYCRSIVRTELNGVNHISHRFCYHFRFAVSSSFLKNDMQTLTKKLLICSIGHWIKNNILRGSESLSRLCLNLTTNFDWIKTNPGSNYSTHHYFASVCCWLKVLFTFFQQYLPRPSFILCRRRRQVNYGCGGIRTRDLGVSCSYTSRRLTRR